MLDIVNEQLLGRGEEPIAFDSDCREGICGTCSLTINGEAHGPDHPGAACELYMRKFRDRVPTSWIEPFRVKAFPVIEIWWSIAARSIASVPPRRFLFPRAASFPAPEANSVPVLKARCRSFDGSGRVHRLRRVRGGVPERLGDALHRGESFSSRVLPQGEPERTRRVPSVWCRRWMRKALAIAPTLTNAKRFVRLKSAQVSSRN